MARNLVRVNLNLERPIYEKLKKISRGEGKSVSQLTREILRRAVEGELGGDQVPVDLVTRIRRLRHLLPPLTDSSAIIRRSREAGW